MYAKEFKRVVYVSLWLDGCCGSFSVAWLRCST
jgi:hypothetical protein